MEDEIRRGRKAQQVLEDETLSAAVRKLENDQLWLFRSSKPDESAKRETAWCMLQAIDLLRQELIKVMDAGKIAQKAFERTNRSI